MKLSLSRLLALTLIPLSLAALLASCDADGEDPLDSTLTEALKPDGQIPPADYDSPELASFDLTPGIYYDAVALTLKSQSQDYTIRYTTDCSEPTADSPVYTDAIPMSYLADSADAGATIYNIRARCFDKDGAALGHTVSATYIFPESKDRFTTKVISLVTEEKNLYGETGILDNYEWRGRESERPVNFQLYGTDGSLLISQDMGIRIYGTGSRKNEQKNFRLFARREYTPHTGHVNYPVFPNLYSETTGARIEEFDKLLVRGGASNFHNSMITNLIAHEMMEGSNVPAGDFEPAALYFNGEYYGLMMLLEDYDTYSYEEHYGASEDQVSTVNFGVHSNGLTWELDDGPEAEFAEWMAVDQYLFTTDFSDEAEYTRVKELIDIDNIIEYIVFECYVNNWDWPRNNQRIWRYYGIDGENSQSGVDGAGGYDPDAPLGQDGRWRFVVKDIDVSMGMNVNPELGYYAELDTNFFDVMRKDRYGKNHMYDIFKNLLKNDDFRQRFYLYICEFMNTRGAVDNYLDIINRLSLQIAEEMKYHTAEYGDTLADWDRHLSHMRNFAIKRPDFVFEDVNEYSSARGDGYLMNRVTLEIVGKGTFTYNGGSFTKSGLIYSLKEVTLPVTATPAYGYKFARIEVEGGRYENGKLSLPSDECKVKVIFEEDPSYTAPVPTSPVINEVGFTSAHKVNGHDFIELYNPTSAELSLKGYSLTCGNATYTFPSITIPANGFRVFLFGTGEGALYLPIEIDKGETLALKNDKGELIDSALLLAPGKDSLIGRYPDGGDWVAISPWDITPGMPNLHGTGNDHYYADPVRHNVMFNGVLMDDSMITFGKTEDGKATFLLTDVHKLQSSLPRSIYNILIDALDKFDADHPILLSDYVTELNKSSEYVSAFYVESLDSAVIRIFIPPERPEEVNP